MKTSSHFPKANLLWLLLPAALVISRFVLLGTAEGHDLKFHVTSWLEVSRHWQQGVVLPSWAGLANFGAGEPRFLFYPPLPWLLGGLLWTVLPAQATAGAFVFICVALSAATMYLAARSSMDRPSATLAAVAYALNPYQLAVIFWRAAYAELLAAAIFPLLLLGLRKALDAKRFGLLLASCSLAFLWYSNAPAAVIGEYVVLLLLVVAAVQARQLRFLFRGFAVLIAGPLLAAPYVLTVLQLQTTVSLASAIANANPANTVLFSSFRAEPLLHRFNLFVSFIVVALALMGIAAFAARRRQSEGPLNRWIVWMFSAALFLMTPLSLLLWRALPKMQFVQYTWRWSFVLAFAVSWAIAASQLRSWRRWTLAFAVSAAVLALAFVRDIGRANIPQWSTQAQQRGYAGVPEYLPVAARTGDSIPPAPVTLTSGDAAHVQWQVQHQEHWRFAVSTSRPERLRLHLFNYPLWRAEVNGSPVDHGNNSWLTVPIPAGPSTIDVRFAAPPSRYAGTWIAIAALAAVLAFELRKKTTAPAVTGAVR